MNILRRIQYSKIGKIIFKKGPLLEIARKLRRTALRILGRVQELNTAEPIDLLQEIKDNFETVMLEESTDEVIDIIVPIYNGYDYLVRLFEDLQKTSMKTRIILVDDKSPDERVHILEKEYVAKYENVILLENEENYGFVKTTNKGLEAAKGHHVALVNTDTELPVGWLERLMAPILVDSKVATTTPYTNSGTIFSFPYMGINNKIYRGLDVDTIDKYFKTIKPRFVEAPTGVGFCMGMSKHAIKDVGLLDYETYDRGYGEENDWCQRAIKKGYKNVQVENLFVYHKHGGSFLSDEKKKLIENHSEKLRRRYPGYDGQVGKFVTKDINRNIRFLMRMVIDTHEMRSVLCFDHNLGGGATSYLEKKKKECFRERICISTVRYDHVNGRYTFDYEDGEVKLSYIFNNFEDLFKIGEKLHWDEIWINELVTYPYLWKRLDNLKELKKQQNAKMIMLMHDYFALCPTINLLTEDYQYCGMPEESKCQACYNTKNYAQDYECPSQKEWVKRWKAFFEVCNEIRCFSQDTLKRVEDVFGKEFPFTLIPHQVNYMVPISKEHSLSDTLTIGLLGVLTRHKGSDLVEGMLKEIQEKKLNVRIVLLGKVMGANFSVYPNFKETGEYHVTDLPKLIYENDIDVFMVGSVCPETFSYTTDEIMKMGMPIVSFDIGAPVERISKYEKGAILTKRDPQIVLDEIHDFVVNKLKAKENIIEKKKVIYIAEYTSFSSRYRLEHMYEQLLYTGVIGEIWETENLPKQRNWEDVDAVVIYRCRDLEPITSLITEIKGHNIPIIYDIDDYIFEYDNIKDLDFMKDEQYSEFGKYCVSIRKCMEKMDIFTTSTENMKMAIQQSFPEKPVFVNRNVASAKMLIYSLLAYESRIVNTDKVVLGYFSGSATHSRDFELIADVLLSVMKQRENVYLKIVGCLELPKGFEGIGIEDRIIRQGFMDWTELPLSIAECDINLMPLEDTFFHRCKSENKWMEAALVHVPTIGSYNDEIALATVDGENIVLCNNAEEWERQLLHLIDHEDVRCALAESAYSYVMKKKNTLASEVQQSVRKVLR